MKELIQDTDNLLNKTNQAYARLDLDKKKTEIKALNIQMNEPNFWNDNKKAQQISKQAADLQEEVEVWEKLKQETEEIKSLAEQTAKEDDKFKKDLEKKLDKLQEQFSKLEFSLMMNGEYDNQNAILAIHAGAGGTDAQDWAEMLLRMYLRYVEDKKWQVNVIDKSPGSEAGIKSVVLEIQGKYAYGWLKSEAGVHRLVRISPFDAEKMRHTSFALVELLPELEEIEELEIQDEDLEVTTAKSSGPGGQGVNTTDSAVRIKHKPTGLMARCQNERSQLQNKQTALKILKSKLHQYHLAEQEEEKQKLRGEFSEAAWGNQIRSYVLHPYKMVKDHRSNFETQDVEKILDGGLDEVIENYLRQA